MVSFLFGTLSLLALQSPSNVDRRPKSSTAESYSKLLGWLDDTFPNSYVNSNVKIAPSEMGGHGCFATADIKEGELLFTIPREACISSSIVFEDDDTGKAFQTLIKKAGPGSFTVSLAGYLAKEYLCYIEGQDVLFGPVSDC